MRGIMKKFAVLMLALASLGAMTGCDDDDDSVKVPAAVQDTFGRMFPGAGHVEWAGKQGYLVAEFREGGTDMQAWFDAAGKWYMTEEDVPYALLPQAVRTAFESGEYAAWHVDDADKLTREGLETVYVLEVEQRDAEYELVYSANSQKQTGTDIRSEDAGPAALSSGQGIGLTRPRHSACENATHVHRLFRKRGYRGGIRIRVRRDYRRGFGRRRAISVSAA